MEKFMLVSGERQQMFIWMIKAEFMRKYNGNYSWLFRSWCIGVSQEEQKWEEKVNWVHSSQTSPGPELQCVLIKQMLFLLVYLILTMDLWCVTKDWEEQWLCLSWSHRRLVVFLFWNKHLVLSAFHECFPLLTWPLTSMCCRVRATLALLGRPGLVPWLLCCIPG